MLPLAAGSPARVVLRSPSVRTRASARGTARRRADASSGRPCAVHAPRRPLAGEVRRPGRAPGGVVVTVSSARQAQTQILQFGAGLLDRGAENAGQGPHVVSTNRQDAPVEILALDLDHAEVATQHLGLAALELL